MPSLAVLVSISAAATACLLSACITWAIRPLLSRWALARPNSRSSHRVPTPQGAGIAVIGATIIVGATLIVCASATDVKVAVSLFGATFLIAVIGFADDVKTIPILPRLILQALAVGALVFATPSELRIFAAFPLGLERVLTLLAGLWFVNLVNFMDGLDLMTVAETVPITAALVILGLLGNFPMSATIIASALCGAMLGFSPFNRPTAKIFLGDVGSLPIGLLLGWCLLQLAYHQQFVCAVLLPLYYLMDATVTLLRRISRGEPFWEAHRSHFYQLATSNRFTVLRVISEVFSLNIGLSALAIVSTITQSSNVQALLLFIGCLSTALLMYRFSKPRLSS